MALALVANVDPRTVAKALTRGIGSLRGDVRVRLARALASTSGADPTHAHLPGIVRGEARS